MSAISSSTTPINATNMVLPTEYKSSVELTPASHTTMPDTKVLPFSHNTFAAVFRQVFSFKNLLENQESKHILGLTHESVTQEK